MNGAGLNTVVNSTRLVITLLTAGSQGVTGCTGPTGPTGPSQWSVYNSNDIYYTTGNVGIGSSTPNYTLDIVGNTNIIGNTTISPNLIVTGNIYLNGVQVSTSGGGGGGGQWSNGVTSGNIYYTGNVGIGGGDPQYSLDVSGTTNIKGNLIIYNDASFNGNISVSRNIYINGVPVTTGSSSQWSNGVTSGNIYYTGNVGIGGGDPQYSLDISGTVYITGTAYATYFISTSDYRIKQNPKPLDSSFNVDDLKPIHYTNKISKKEDLGFIAHEVQEVFPYLVEGDKDGSSNQTLNYIGLIAVLVKEIQELKKRVSILENK